MFRRMLLTATLCAISAFALAAQHQGNAGKDTHATSPLPAFRTVDRNHDGKIDIDEARAVPSLKIMFGAADKNGDGTLSKSEYDALSRGAHRG